MKIYFYISVAASALSLVLAVVLFWVAGTNQGLQTEVQKQQQQYQQQQQEIQRPQLIDQKLTGPIIQDMASVAGKDDKMKALLEKYGFKIVTPTPAPNAAAPTPAPKPAARTETPSLQP